MTVDRAIKRTIEYSRDFGAKITREELKYRLISSIPYSDNEIDECLIRKGIKLSKLKNSNIEPKIKLAKQMVLGGFSNWNEIVFVGITGSVSALHPKQNDDIDLMVVTRNNLLWWTRFKLRLYIWAKGIPHRKFGAKENKNEFCFNLWLEERSLELLKDKQNLKNAEDLIMMLPVLSKYDCYRKLLIKNNWSRKFVATGFNQRINSIKRGIKNVEPAGAPILMKWLNYVFFWLQYGYMRHKITNETVDIKRAFFHRN